VILFYTRKDFSDRRGWKTRRWEHAFAEKDMIGIFAPSVYERLTSYKFVRYESTIVHETCHVYYMNIVHNFTPKWLAEGLATNLEQYDYGWRGKPRVDHLYFMKIPFGEDELEFYRSGYLITHMLIRKLGMKRLMSLIREYARKPVKTNYERLFDKFVYAKNTD
jgi:hypothetical protein